MSAFRPRKKFIASLIAVAVVSIAFFVAQKTKQSFKVAESAIHTKEEVMPALRTTVGIRRTNFGHSLIDTELTYESQGRPTTLREVGDTVKFSGYTIVKIDSKVEKENPELALLQEDWAREAYQFLSGRLGFSAEQIELYSKASEHAFADYHRKTMAILESAKKEYGPDLALVIEGPLQTEYDNAWKAYDDSIKKIMGDRGTEDFKDFVNRFHSQAFQRVGFVPDFIR